MMNVHNVITDVRNIIKNVHNRYEMVHMRQLRRSILLITMMIMMLMTRDDYDGDYDNKIEIPGGCGITMQLQKLRQM